MNAKAMQDATIAYCGKCISGRVDASGKKHRGDNEKQL